MYIFVDLVKRSEARYSAIKITLMILLLFSSSSSSSKELYEWVKGRNR